MTVKEYLMQIWQLDKEIEIKYRELEQLRQSIGIRAMRHDEAVKPGGSSDQVASAAIRIMSMEECLDRKIDKLIDLRQTITEQIDGLESRTFRNVLTCRYVLMLSWDEIAELMEYDVRHCHRIHGRALQVFEKKYMS